MVRKYPNLCKPLQLGGLILKNRMFSAPMSYPNITKEGLITPEMAAFYELRARGGAAAVSVSEALTHPATGKAHAREINMQAEYAVMGLAETARSIKRHGAAASLELSHGGMHSEIDSFEKNFTPENVKYSASAGELEDGRKILEMPKEMIREVVDSFGESAALAKRAGYDIIFIHGGHGWLLQQFLSPLTNHRTDEYGGSLLNRARISLEIIDSVRKAVGPKIPIEFRMSAEEYMAGGYTFGEAIEFAKLIEDKVDLLHVSTGSLVNSFRHTHVSMFEERGCNVHYAAEIKKHVSVPVATVGGLVDPDMMEKIIADGEADVVEMARALLADPYLPNKVALGRDDEINRCIRCFTCLSERTPTKTRICALNPQVGRETELAMDACPARKSKRVLVAGGGPGGMEAALTAAKRGHSVVLCEKESALGGAVRSEKFIPFKADVARLAESKAVALKEAGVEIRLNTPVTAEYVEKEAPDALIVAIGAAPIVPKLEGIDGENVIMAEEAAEQAETLGQNVVILGGGLVGCELAIHLAQIGKTVTLVEMAPVLAADANRVHRRVALQVIDEEGISVRTGLRGVRISGEGLVCADRDGNELLIPGDTVVCAVGRARLWDEAEKLLDSAPEVALVGDCLRPATIREAVYRGYHAGLDL